MEDEGNGGRREDVNAARKLAFRIVNSLRRLPCCKVVPRSESNAVVVGRGDGAGRAGDGGHQEQDASRRGYA